MVRNLGWFSIALGVVELLAARHLARGADLPHDDVAVARIAGVRGVAAGIGLLEGRPGVHIGAPVAGDVLDLATLALPARRFDAGPMRRRYPARGDRRRDRVGPVRGLRALHGRPAGTQAASVCG
jgi:hypothetical protein